MHLGERLKEERERLGYNQTDFAALASSTRKTLFNWESDLASPSATALAAWGAVGLDVLYVVTGQRNAPVAPALSRRAAALLDNYEHTDEAGKKIIEGTASLAAKSKDKAA